MSLEDQIDLHLAAEKDKIINRIDRIKTALDLALVCMDDPDQPHRLVDEILWLCEFSKQKIERERT